MTEQQQQSRGIAGFICVLTPLDEVRIMARLADKERDQLTEFLSLAKDDGLS